MSNNQRYLNNKNKTQHKFTPKSQTINSNPTLSDSIRKQQKNQQSSSSATSCTAAVTVVSGDGGNFVNYLPQDEAVAAGLGVEEGGLDAVESQKVVDLLNAECSRLLKLNPKLFWKQVASDASLHAFLESFLKYRSRWYDFPYRGAKGIVAGVIVGENELNRRVFMILYRISSNRDPGAKASDSLSAKDHAVILQEKNLLDLPKLLDICAIYGHENEELTRTIVTNAIMAQPSIHDSLSASISHFLNIVHTMYERCTTSVEVLLSARDAHNDSSSRLHTDYLEVMDFINDAIVSMDALITAYNHAAVYFSCPVLTSYGSDELLKILARLHDSLLPTLQQGLQILFLTKKDDMLPKVVISLKMLSSRIVDICWKLLNLCYLSGDLFGESVIPLPSASKIFPAQVEEPIIRTDILIQTFREISEECLTVQEGRSVSSLLQSVEKKYHLMGRLELLGNEGWIVMDNEQLQFLSGIMLVPTTTDLSHFSSNNVVELDEDSAIINSQISQVKDIFPDYGNGFISACLEVYNHNPEEVIQRILEGTLHNDLLSLDTSLAVLPPKTTVPLVSQKDKGKGKMIEQTMPLPTPASVLPPPSSTSSSSVGRFVRKSTPNVFDSEILDTKDETSKSFAIKSMIEYEDEYDDSFDDLGLGVGDSGLDDLSEKVTSSEDSASDASRWGSRQKPQFFVKDGKNYSYKVSGSVAAANYNEASLVNQTQKGMVHGLGRGGNFPLGAAQKVMELNEVKSSGKHNVTGNSGRREVGRNSNTKDHNAPTMKSNEGHDEQHTTHQVGGRGRGWGRGSIGNEQNVTRLNEVEGSNGSVSGRGGRGRGWGRGNNGNEQNVARSNEGEDSNESVSGRRGRGFRGRGRGRGNIEYEQTVADSNEGEDSNDADAVSERGRGRGGRRGGGRRNNYRKDQAMKKHLSGLGGF